MSNNKTYKEKLIAEREKKVKQIKQQVSILDLAKDFFSLEKHGSRLFKLTEHPSCILNPVNNTFTYFSQGLYGDVFEFLKVFQECGNLSFNKAFNYLLPKIDLNMEPSNNLKHEKQNKPKPLQKKQLCAKSLKEQLKLDDTNKNIIAYLIKERKIDPNIVYNMLEKKYIAQAVTETGSKVLAFCGYNDYGMLASVSIRSCNSKSSFKGDFKNCDYDYGWFYSPGIEPSSFCPDIPGEKPLICFEGYIDMMSYLDINKNNNNINDYNYLTLGSVDKWETVLKYQERFNIKNISLAFDNDNAGNKIAQKLKTILEEKDVQVYLDIPNEKDWNEQLKKSKTISLTQRITNAKNMLSTQEVTTQKSKEFSR